MREGRAVAAAEVNTVVRRFGIAHRNRTAAMLNRHGVSIGQELLILELGANGPCTQSHLAEVAGCEASTITIAVRKLDAAGLVRRRTSAADARSRLVELTEDGRAALTAVRRVQRGVADRIRGCFDSEQACEEFLDALARTTEALSKTG